MVDPAAAASQQPVMSLLASTTTSQQPSSIHLNYSSNENQGLAALVVGRGVLRVSYPLEKTQRAAHEQLFSSANDKLHAKYGARSGSPQRTSGRCRLSTPCNECTYRHQQLRQAARCQAFHQQQQQQEGTHQEEVQAEDFGRRRSQSVSPDHVDVQHVPSLREEAHFEGCDQHGTSAVLGVRRRVQVLEEHWAQDRTVKRKVRPL